MDRPQIHLRLPQDLHDQLRATADAQGISLNSLLVALLAGSVGWTLDPKKKGSRRKGPAEPTTATRSDLDAADAA